MRRTTLAIALATGALAVPAVALAAGGDEPPTQTRPAQQQEPQRPDRGDCPNHDGGGESSGGGSGSETVL